MMQINYAQAIKEGLEDETRSLEYHLGMGDELRFRFENVDAVCMFPKGSCSYDAYEAGRERGRQLYEKIRYSIHY